MPLWVPISRPSMSKADRGSLEAIIETSPCRFTSKNPTVIQTAYWCVRTVVKFMTRCNISIRQDGCSRLSIRGGVGIARLAEADTGQRGIPEISGKLFPGQMDQNMFGYPLLNENVIGAPLAVIVTGGSALRRRTAEENSAPCVGGKVGSWLLRNRSPGSPALLSTLASDSWKSRRTGIAPG